MQKAHSWKTIDTGYKSHGFMTDTLKEIMRNCMYDTMIK